MHSFNNLQLTDLMDMLTDFTNHFTKFQSEPCNEKECNHYKTMIQRVQAEIKSRQEPIYTENRSIGLDKLMVILNANAKHGNGSATKKG